MCDSSAVEATTDKKPNSWLLKIAGFAGLAALLLVIAGVVVRVTIRDQYLISGLVYYVTSPASMILLLLFSFFFMQKTWRNRRRLAVGLIPVAALWMFAGQWISNDALDQSPAEKTSRLMFWNAGEGVLGWSRIFAVIQQQNPDIIALAEADTLKDQDEAFFDSNFPGYERIHLPRRLLLLSRFPIISQHRLRWIRGAVYESVVIESPRGQVTLVFSDVASTLSLHRKEPIKVLVEATSKLQGPVIVVGDLNTPVDSLFFDDFRKEFTNAFEASGNGLYTTWPMPLPVIAIDHMWGNDFVRFSDARILWTLASDHRPVIAEFHVRDSVEVKSQDVASGE